MATKQSRVAVNAACGSGTDGSRSGEIVSKAVDLSFATEERKKKFGSQSSHGAFPRVPTACHAAEPYFSSGIH
jgi:hypothetical protein